MSHTCPECGAEQPINVLRCGVCGARMVPLETPADQVGGEDILNYSLFVIGLILIAIGVPCGIGLLCVLLGR